MLNASLIKNNSDKENNYVQSLLIKKDKSTKNLNNKIQKLFYLAVD